MSSIARMTSDRARSVEQLKMDVEGKSQWLHAAPFRSCFCVTKKSIPARWIIEGLLPNGETVELGNYSTGNLFAPGKPRYITVNVMCGLPIRFVCDASQGNAKLWVIFKS